MSNHSGSYLINEILCLLDEFKFFKSIGQEKTLTFLKDIKKLSYGYDCNDGEILEELGEKLKVCHTCWEYSDDLKYGVCDKCREHWIT